MIVLNKINPNQLLFHRDQKFQFKDGRCEIPEQYARELTQVPGEYELEHSGGFVNFLPFNPSTWTKDYKKIVWDGPVGYNNGYGKASMTWMKALARKVDLRIINSRWIGTVMEHVDDELQAALDKPLDVCDSYYVRFFPAHCAPDRSADRTVLYSMLEASRIPLSWVDIINTKYERCVVPCMHQKEAFIASGVKVDIGVVPLLFDPFLFPELPDREDDGNFVFGQMGTLTYRKGTDILLEAFEKAFPREKYPDVQLYIKTLPLGGIATVWWDKWGYSNPSSPSYDPRVVLNAQSFSPEELVNEFFGKVDCFVFPTHGEGWGLPVMEAMAMKVPTIATAWSGIADFFNDKYGYTIDYTMGRVPNGTVGGYPEDLQHPEQEWANPSVDDLAEKMLHVYNHRSEARKKATLASKYIRTNFTIDKSSQKLIDYLDAKF